MLLDAVDRLIAAVPSSPATDVTAEQLRLIATQIDDGDAPAAVVTQLHQSLAKALATLAVQAPEGTGPRIGLLVGDAARVVAMGLGYPDPDGVDLDRFDAIEALRLKRERRTLGLESQPGLQAVLDASIEAR